MDLTSPAQLFGYLGTALIFGAGMIIAFRQRTNAFYWVLKIVGGVSWITAGILMESGAVIADGLVFAPIILWGVWRYRRFHSS